MQIKTTFRFHPIPGTMATIKEKKNTTNAGEDVWEKECFFIAS
jgi:hypothetical protein